MDPALRNGHCMTGKYNASLWHSDTPRQRLRARQICETCPLLEPCRRYALESLRLESTRYGVKVVVAGLTEDELRAERRRLGIAPPQPAPMPSTQRVPLLPVTTVEDEELRKVRRTVTIAHGKGFHDDGPRTGCPRCSTQQGDTNPTVSP